MTKIEAELKLQSPCDATTLLEVAKAIKVKGALIKKFKNGEELRAYAFPKGWENTRIRSFPHSHNI